MMTISSQASVAIENANLYNELLSLYLHTIESLAAAIDAKDSYTHGHSRRVMDYSIAIAAALGMEKTNLNTLRHTALLHDIGKIGISEAILQKPGKLTNEEFDYIKGHPVVGAHILESIEFLKEVRMQMKHHHEKYDGSGYPDGLKGEEIPLGARIIAVADTYDAMTSTRSYRRGLEHQLAVEEIARCSGTQFDPEIVAVFLKIEDDVRKYNDNLEENRTPLPLVIKQSMMQ
jgi:putative nucleotidyltransferase with HDIG domain